MELLLQTLSQAPMVALIAYLWWTSHKESRKEIERLQERVHEKDDQLKEFARVLDKFTISLELIKDRLHR